jgi:hypothetical protein
MHEVRIILTDVEFDVLKIIHLLNQINKVMYQQCDKRDDKFPALMKLACLGLIEQVSRYPTTWRITSAGVTVIHMLGG